MKRNKLLFGIVFMFLIVLGSVFGATVLDINANPTTTADTTFYGTPIGGNDSDGKYIDFDGSSDYLKFNNLGLDYNVNINFSTSTATQQGILSTVLTTTGRDGLLIYLDASYKLFVATYSANTQTSAITGGAALNDGVVHNISITRYDSNNSIYVYLDGAFIGSDISATQTTNNIEMHFSKIYTSQTSNYFDGKLYNIDIKNNSDAIIYQLNATPLTDWSGNGNHAEIGASGQVLDYINSGAQAWDFDGTNDYVKLPTVTGIKTLSFWHNPDIDIIAESTQQPITNWDITNSNRYLWLGSSSGAVTNEMVFYSTTTSVGYYWTSTQIGLSTISAGTWYNYNIVWDSANSNYRLYFNGVDKGLATKAGSPTEVTTWTTPYIGKRSTNYGDFKLSQLQLYNISLNQSNVTEIYNNGAFYNANIEPAEQDTHIESISFLEQEGTTTVNSVTYVDVFTGNFTVPYNNTNVSATVSFNTEYLGISTATCRILIDSVDKNSEASRSSLGAGTTGSMFIMTELYNLSAGNHTGQLQCKKTGSNGFIISNAFAVAHIARDSDGHPIDFKFYNTTLNLNSTNYTVLYEFNTTTGTYNGTGIISKQYDMNSIWNYDSTSQLGLQGRVLYTNGSILATGSEFIRNGSIGSVGSGGLFLMARGFPQNETFTIQLLGKSTTLDGNIGIKLIEKEFFTPSSYVVEEELDNLIISGENWTNLLTAELNATDLAISSIFLGATISGAITNGTVPTDVELRYVTNGVVHGFMTRTFNSLDQYGIINFQHAIDTVLATNNITIQARLTNNNGTNFTIHGGNLVSFLTNDIPLSAVSYNVTAFDLIDNTSISNFSVYVGDLIFTTTSGYAIISPQNSLENLTIVSDNYFNYTVVNHPVINDLNVSLTPYLQFNFTAESALTNISISNFTINCSTYDNSSTTSGELYYQLSDNANLTNITCLFSSDGFANTLFNVTDLNYSKINNYTIRPYTTNSVLITYKDSITKALLTNVTLELISETYSVSYDLGLNSSIYLDLLAPETYELRSTKDGYDTGFYSFTLSNRTFNNITLYLSNGTTQVTASVVDQYNDILEGAIIKTLKYDIDSNSYLLQSIRTVNFEGEAILNILLNEEYYKFVIEYPAGTIVKSTEPTYITQTTITFKVVLGEEILENYYKTGSVDHSLIFNPTTNNFRFIYNDNDNLVTKGCLEVYEMGINGNTLIYTECSLTSVGSLLVLVDNTTYKKYIAKGYIYYNSDEQFLDEEIVDFREETDFGNMGLWLLFIMTFSIIFIMVGAAPKLTPALAPLPLLLFSILGMIAIPVQIGVAAWIVGIIVTIIITR